MREAEDEPRLTAKVHELMGVAGQPKEEILKLLRSKGFAIPFNTKEKQVEELSKYKLKPKKDIEAIK
jgi:hypothetical protein